MDACGSLCSKVLRFGFPRRCKQADLSKVRAVIQLRIPADAHLGTTAACATTAWSCSTMPVSQRSQDRLWAAVLLSCQDNVFKKRFCATFPKAF